MQKVKGLIVLDVPLGSHGLSFHSFYIKEHSENKVQKASSKTLFVGNIDYRDNLSSNDVCSLLTEIFGVFGDVESVSVSDFSLTHQQDGRNSRFAHVSFKNKSSIKSIFSSTSHAIFNEIKKNIATKWGISNGIPKLSSSDFFNRYHYDFEDPDTLKEEASSYMRDFEENEQVDALKRKRESEVDEDGFMQVSHRKRSKISSSGGSKQRGGGSAGSEGRSRNRNKTKKSLELTNFYRFQMREEKQGRLEDLRKKFEQDKLKIASLKANRKFKPF